MKVRPRTTAEKIALRNAFSETVEGSPHTRDGWSVHLLVEGNPFINGPLTCLSHFLACSIVLRTLDVSEEVLIDRWRLEKKLLQLLQVDSTGSKAWFLDARGATNHPKHRLLLSHYDR